MDDGDELLDLVDKNDNKIGTILRSQTADLHKQNHGFLRASEILIRNHKGELWIPRRVLHKRIAPGALDYSSSGHVASGESYIQAALREVREELNLDLKPDQLILLHKFPPIGDEPAYIRSAYICATDSAPKYNLMISPAMNGWLLRNSLNGSKMAKQPSEAWKRQLST